MDQVYYLKHDNTARPLHRIACRNEDKELQSLLERNLHLLPSSQISPEKQLDWLLVKREMPVVSPALGEANWSIDFLLLDQDSVPTLVECKRKDDPRSKREVIGQMLDYAANGKNYWTASDFRSHAQNTAGGELQLEDALNKLGHTEISASDFFDIAEQNLKRSRMRLIFFLGESSFELRSIVEFLNGQFKETEVLIVEARQYAYGESRLIIPWVFGFTEEARVAKKEAKAEAVRTARVRGEVAFWDRLQTSLPKHDEFSQVQEFFSAAKLIPGLHLTWASGTVFKMPGLLPAKIIFGVHASGKLEIYLINWWPARFPIATPEQAEARAVFGKSIEAIFELTIPDQQTSQYRQYRPEFWLPRREEILALLQRLSNLCDSAGKHTKIRGAGVDTEESRMRPEPAVHYKGQISDASEHEVMLNNPEASALSEERGREAARAAGLSEAEIARMIPFPEESKEV